MKILGLTVSNFLGVQHLQHAMENPILFIAGDNGAGKSSLQQAIRFALTGFMPRGVSKVADRAKLLTEGASTGFVQLDTGTGTIRRNIKDAKLVGELPDQPYLDLCLDAAQFARLADVDRRKLLFAITKTRINNEVVAEQLALKEIPASIIEQVLPRLSAGFPTASAFARDKAAEARGAWRAVTGENYGAVKAKTWKAAAPDLHPDPAEIDHHKAEIVTLRDRMPALHASVARVEQAMPAERLKELQDQAASSKRHFDALETLQADYDAKTAKVHELEAAGRGPGGLGPCPCCGKALALRDGALVEVEEAPAPADSRVALSEAKVEAHDAYTALQGARRALACAEAAAQTLKDLPPPPSDDDHAAVTVLESVSDLIRQHELALADLQRAQAAEGEAVKRTQAAADHHSDAVAWAAAEDALAAEGIPSILLARALDPVNAALAQLATASGWRQPVVTKDIELTYGGRAYALLSESEQWRADALFAATIARLTGTNLLLLDRFDVLAPQHRGDALDWFDFLVAEAGIETVIVSGTLKAKPDLGEGIDVIWLS